MSAAMDRARQTREDTARHARNNPDCVNTLGGDITITTVTWDATECDTCRDGRADL